MRNAGAPGGQGVPASVTLDLEELLPEALESTGVIAAATGALTSSGYRVVAVSRWPRCGPPPA